MLHLFCISYQDDYLPVHLSAPTNLYGMSNMERLPPNPPLITIWSPDISQAFLFGHLHTLHGSMSCSPRGGRHLSGCPPMCPAAVLYRPTFPFPPALPTRFSNKAVNKLTVTLMGGTGKWDRMGRGEGFCGDSDGQRRIQFSGRLGSTCLACFVGQF